MSALVARALVVLGAGFLLSIAGITALAILELPIPDVLQNLAVGSMGMIGALLVRGGSDDSGADEAPERPETPA